MIKVFIQKISAFIVNFYTANCDYSRFSSVLLSGKIGYWEQSILFKHQDLQMAGLKLNT